MIFKIKYSKFAPRGKSANLEVPFPELERKLTEWTIMTEHNQCKLPATVHSCYYNAGIEFLVR